MVRRVGMAVMRISDVAKRRSAEKRKWITPASGVCGSASANTKTVCTFHTIIFVDWKIIGSTKE